MTDELVAWMIAHGFATGHGDTVEYLLKELAWQVEERVRQARLEEAKAMSEKIDTGDYVHHEPTGENWVVACVDGDRLHWCGWPEGEANLSDCTLIRKATPEERRKRLEEIASMSADCHRKRHAVATLEAERAELERQEVDLLSRICKLLERQQEEERK